MKVSSTRYMCPWEHFCAYGVEMDGRSCLRWCIRELSYNSAQPPLSRAADLVRRKVSSTRYMCPWEHFCAYVGEIDGRSCRGGASESCRTSRLQPPLSRAADFVRMKVSSTLYMCAWAHFRAYGGEIDGRSCPKWCIRELSYNSAPPAT